MTLSVLVGLLRDTFGGALQGGRMGVVTPVPFSKAQLRDWPGSVLSGLELKSTWYCSDLFFKFEG